MFLFFNQNTVRVYSRNNKNNTDLHINSLSSRRRQKHQNNHILYSRSVTKSWPNVILIQYRHPPCDIHDPSIHWPLLAARWSRSGVEWRSTVTQLWSWLYSKTINLKVMFVYTRREMSTLQKTWTKVRIIRNEWETEGEYVDWKGVYLINTQFLHEFVE